MNAEQNSGRPTVLLPDRDTTNFLFYRQVNQDSINDFTITLENWSLNNRGADEAAAKPLRIQLNTGGGNIVDGLALVETIKRLRGIGHKVTVAAYGRAGSCAAFILQAADVRVIGSESWLLIHEASSACNGPLSAMKREVKRTQELQEQTIELLCRRSRLTRKQILRKISNGADWWIRAQTALKEHELVDLIELEMEPRQ
ncbi:MAG TPA: ATP-dependent Clp protease proteolytic subunit [Planktothrix sp.]|jgi:ATP-dependent protease ClpP protease subunit